MVTIPPLWLRGSTELKVNNSKGSNVFREFGMFDPNNKHHRIALPWTEKEIANIFNTVIMEYNPAMQNWMKGTGGGSGAGEDFSVWEIRDPILFVDYSNQAARIYLSVVYIWDKEYGFILVTKKETIPASAAFDDCFMRMDDDEDNNNNDDHDADGSSGGAGGQTRKG